MNFWAWFWIWTALVIGSLAVFVFIGKGLFNRVLSILYQVNQILPVAQKLFESLEAKPKAEDKESDVLASSSELEEKRRVLLKRNSKKRAARQRSLRSAIKNIDVNESRFTND
jgi:ABC-type multidrug transport system fused ATPase/permease subunit